MNKSIKLNGPIRALFKSKAKQKMESQGHSVGKQLALERQKLIEELVSLPQVKPMHQKMVKLISQRDAIEVQITAAHGELLKSTGAYFNTGNKGEFSYYGNHKQKGLTGRPDAIYRRYTEAEGDEKKANACHCTVGDSPELLEFVANLSLVKTVGEAEELLAKL